MTLEKAFQALLKHYETTFPQLNVDKGASKHYIISPAMTNICIGVFISSGPLDNGQT